MRPRMLACSVSWDAPVGPTSSVCWAGQRAGGLKLREWKMRYEQNWRGRKYRSDNVWKAVKTENSKILGMFARTERSQMALNDEQRYGVYIHYKSP